VSEFHAEAPRANASEGLDQGPYVVARAGFKPATLRKKGDESTNEPQRSTGSSFFIEFGSIFLEFVSLTVKKFIWGSLNP